MRRLFFVMVGIAACHARLDLGHTEDGGTSVGDAGKATCESVCDRAIACALIASDKRTQCLAQCVGVPQATLDCAMTTQCQDIVNQCSPFTEGPADSSVVDDFENQQQILECQDHCDTLNFFQCLNASELGVCRGACTTSTKEKRGTFIACSNSPARDCNPNEPNNPATDCYRLFVGD